MEYKKEDKREFGSLGLWIKDELTQGINPITVDLIDPNKYEYYHKRKDKYYFRNMSGRITATLKDSDMGDVKYGTKVEITYNT